MPTKSMRAALCWLLSCTLTLLPLGPLVASGAAKAQTAGSGAPAPGACTLIPNSQTCIDATPCKLDSSGVNVCLKGVAPPSGGLNIAQTCWQYSYQYACAANAVDTCQSYRTDPSCSVLRSTCQDSDPTTGKCTEFELDYRCMTSPAQTAKKTVCSGGLFDAAAMPTPTNANGTFGQAAVMQEMLRQAQVYSQRGKEIFSGVPETCRKGYAGLQNCCKVAPGGKTNSAVAQVAFGAGASVVKYYGAQAIDWASSYVFDAMYNNSIFSAALASAFSTGAETLGTSLASSGFSAGAFGFTASTGTFQAGSGLFGADTQLLSFDGGGFMAFNPYVFAAVLVLMIVQNLVSCNQSEQMLAMHKGSHLSVYERTDCSSKFLGACLAYTDSYCSFNSVLAKIVNVQGKPQLGRNASDCKGFTPGELSQIDFSRIDFSEFMQAMQDKAVAGLPSSAQISSSYQTLMGSTPEGSAQSGTMSRSSNLVGDTRAKTAAPANPNLPTYPKP